MTKISVNDKCPCLSGKKYKKCCFMKDIKLKQNEEDKYYNGHDISSDKIKFCIDYYMKTYDNYKFIDVSNYINTDNYRTYQIKNYNNKTIMIVEKNDNNIELFNTKSNTDDNDIIIMFKGSYRTFNAKNIFKYDDDINKMITKRNKDEYDNNV